MRKWNAPVYKSTQDYIPCQGYLTINARQYRFNLNYYYDHGKNFTYDYIKLLETKVPTKLEGR